MNPALLPAAQVRDIRFFAHDPFATDYLSSLRNDLQDALWARFLICYFNEGGLFALGPPLASAMRDPRSRGLITLTCACGVQAMRSLWTDAGSPRNRLKCFLPADGDGAEDAKLLHSKLAVIVRRRRSPGPPGSSPMEAVLYTGSHNWTGAGLRVPGMKTGRMNVEAATRMVSDWDESWLEHVAPAAPVAAANLVVDALNQIERCFALNSSTDLAAPGADAEFASWHNAYCAPEVAPPGSTPFIVVTGTLGGEVDGRTAKMGTALPALPPRFPSAGETLYVQHFQIGREPEVFDSEAVWALFLWEDQAHLQRGGQPWLILCRPTNLGQRDSGSPSLQAVNWLVYDPHQNQYRAHHPGGATPHPQRVTIGRSGLRSRVTLDVEHWTVAPVLPGTATRALDGRSPDRYALLEVVAVRGPEREPAHERDDRRWRGTELPFNTTKGRSAQKRFVVHDPDGAPSPERAREISDEQFRLFGVRLRGTRGPSGDERAGSEDSFACAAPINEVLFREMEEPGVPVLTGGRAAPEERPRLLVKASADTGRASRGGPPRRAIFEVPRDGGGANPLRVVPRMERLFAPGRAHVVAALGLTAQEEEMLRWGRR